MGTVYVPIPNTPENSKVVEWYPVQKGEGKHFCDDASGEILVEMSVISQSTYVKSADDKDKPGLVLVKGG